MWQARGIATSSFRTGSGPWSKMILVADGATVRALTVPFTMCPDRGMHGECIGDPAQWQVASATVFFIATGDGYYGDVLNDHIDVTISRLCIGETLGLSPVANTSVPAPRPGICGPPAIVYVQVRTSVAWCMPMCVVQIEALAW
jgi:hypothetical protein